MQAPILRAGPPRVGALLLSYFVQLHSFSVSTSYVETHLEVLVEVLLAEVPLMLTPPRRHHHPIHHPIHHWSRHHPIHHWSRHSRVCSRVLLRARPSYPERYPAAPPQCSGDCAAGLAPVHYAQPSSSAPASSDRQGPGQQQPCMSSQPHHSFPQPSSGLPGASGLEPASFSPQPALPLFLLIILILQD